MATVAGPVDFDVERAILWLMRVLGVQGVTGREKAIAGEIIKILGEIGVPSSAITIDKSNEKIPLPTETGNVIVKLKGNRRWSRRLFMTHMDTVPLCAGAIPVRKGNRIIADSPTALGGDDRTGVACLINLIANILEKDLPHPPMTILFTVREESGLWGARFVDLKDLGKIDLCFNVDGRSPEELAIGAVGADRWLVEIIGKASHAGVHPELGISSSLVAALAMVEIHKGGWFGRVEKGGKVGTSNIGSLSDGKGGPAGAATNVVTDYVHIRGESRSHDLKFIGDITRAYRDAFQNAAKKVTNADGKFAKVKFHSERDYFPFRLKENDPVVRHAIAASGDCGWKPVLRAVDGGLDANWMVRHGIPTVTFGAGQNQIHTINEFVDLKDFENGCRFAIALATRPEN